ncbi:aspartyl/asparaginyl beta-hydroxylase [Agrilus planipennis]|uniref:Aspartyl/asparaginyl beta-hydroxylase n=1 Tax=Agrilus planipennis TaxID=224129 RepID=A0A7F5QWC7_AGRPL|nr:aspartyl/asparaginyl beta-hydroxylase [Agrilus planipennis]XP_025829449.1 aspartyl/asparaginyl beta-hydroxylase [Agrilus planipennis]
MSGDVQTRKRKEKKRKKDESNDESQHLQKLPAKIPPAPTDVAINANVHKDSGGGFCAKIVFFILLTALAVLIGLIITEHRGLSDVDSIKSDSKFSRIFDSWIEKSPSDEHDDDSEDKSEEQLYSQEDNISEDDEVSQEDAEDELDSNEENTEEDEEENNEEDSEKVEEEEEEEEEEDEDEEVDQKTDENEEEETDEKTDEEEEEEDEDQERTEENEEEIEEIENEKIIDGNRDVSNQDEKDENRSDEENSKDDEDGDSDEEDEDDEIVKRDTDDKVTSSEKSKIVSKEEDSLEEENKDTENVSKEINGEDSESAQTEKKSLKDIISALPVGTAYDDELTEEKAQSESSTTPKEYNLNEEKRQESEFINVIDITQKGIGEEQNSVSDTKDELSTQDASKDLGEAIHYIPDDPAYALLLFTKLLEKNPSSLKALYGKAQALNSLAAKKKSNALLEEAISTYLLVLQSQRISNEMYKEVAEKCIDRMRFRGYFGKAISVHKALIDKFPDSLEYKYQLVITYLTINRIKEARQLLQKILAIYPDNGFALVHYGFILKTVDNNLNKSVEYLRKGISTKAEGVIDGRFYFHLGDALTKLGRIHEAQQVYIEGVENKLFLSKNQRSLYNVDRLKAKPFWDKKETPYIDFFSILEKNWQNIRDEGMALLNDAGYFEDESENLRDKGEWKQLELFARGIKKKKNCQSCPLTCSIIERLHDARYCRRGQVKFSVMHPGTHVWPHCGPTNCRLRAHLGLKVPDNTFIRVCDEIRSWNEGKILIFDDSFEHEVWHNGTEIRLVLIIDVWHPELSEQEKRSLPAI